MRSIIHLVVSLIVSVGVFATTVFGQVASRPSISPGSGRVASAPSPQFTLILFWKQQDAITQQFAEVLRSAVAARPERAHWTGVDITDQANRAIVEHYGVSRAPMPLALCVADNGAVTGVFTRRPNEEAIERALVTPAMVQVTKALQDKKIVVVHVQPTQQSPLPTGAAAFARDPDFHARTTIVNVVLSDPDESRFLADMKFDPRDAGDSKLVVMAPPGVLIGKFNAGVTKAQIAAQLHAAGKCCNDPNCKHNQRAQ